MSREASREPREEEPAPADRIPTRTPSQRCHRLLLPTCRCVLAPKRPTRADAGLSHPPPLTRSGRYGSDRVAHASSPGCIRFLSGRCGANLADVRCPGRRERGFPGRSLRDVHPSRRWCVRSIRFARLASPRASQIMALRMSQSCTSGYWVLSCSQAASASSRRPPSTRSTTLLESRSSSVSARWYPCGDTADVAGT